MKTKYIVKPMKPKDIAALAIIASNPSHHSKAVCRLRGYAKRIAMELVCAGSSHDEKAYWAARDISAWVERERMD